MTSSLPFNKSTRYEVHELVECHNKLRIAMLREQLRLRNDHLLAQRARLPEEHQELLLETA